jgi:capsular exopolysaccharide synthesis family protein
LPGGQGSGESCGGARRACRSVPEESAEKMSRFYEALRRAEEEARSGSRGVDASEEWRDPPDILWDLARGGHVEYQKLRVWLTNAAARAPAVQTMMVVSGRASTGSTTTAALLAVTLSEGERLRVLVVDGNFRTPAVRLVFNVRNRTGFNEVISDGTSLELGIQRTGRPNLSVLTTGKVSASPAHVFEGRAIDEVIARLKERFDFIIFDAAPVLEFPDAYGLAPKMDGILLVVAAEQTSIREAQTAKRNLEMAGGRLIGAVLNRQRDYAPRILKRILGSSK